MFVQHTSPGLLAVWIGLLLGVSALPVVSAETCPAFTVRAGKQVLFECTLRIAVLCLGVFSIVPSKSNPNLGTKLFKLFSLRSLAGKGLYCDVKVLDIKKPQAPTHGE